MSDWMSRAQFRDMRQRAGFPLNADQHVCHIIAESSGGANHIDNYYVAAASLNQSLGNRSDPYLAEAAGLEQTTKAVAVSRRTGYTGPGAEELIEMARAARRGVPIQQQHAARYAAWAQAAVATALYSQEARAARRAREEAARGRFREGARL